MLSWSYGWWLLSEEDSGKGEKFEREESNSLPALGAAWHSSFGEAEGMRVLDAASVSNCIISQVIHNSKQANSK